MIWILLFIILSSFLIDLIIDTILKDLQDWVVETAKRIKND